MTTANFSPDTILSFWFDEISKESWFRKDPDFDAMIRDRFLEVFLSAAACELASWRQTFLGRLA